MAIIKCKMCGGDVEIAPDKTFGTCEYCGSTMTFPKVDDDQRAAAFNRGNHFRRIGEFDKALQVYERIVREDENDAEAHWCCALCRFGIEYVEDPASFEYIPTCHRASFDNFLEDVDYLAAVEHSDGITRRQYQKDGAKIAEVQRGILATSQNEEPYDVFICYKETDENGDRTRDSAMAQDIYYQLTEQGRRVFFARITLEDKAGAEYEPYIFAALHSAKVMVVVGTSAEHLNAVWVKNEWSRFLAMMKHDRNKLLLPCYRDMDPYDLPEQLSVLQSYDMGKIGFIQDLTRGIFKVLDADKQLEPGKETVVVQQTGGSNADALLKRGYMALEDQEWEKADSFFEEALNINAECAEAYLGKALVAEQFKNFEDLVNIRCGRIHLLQPEKVYAIAENKNLINRTVAECARGKILSEEDIRNNFALFDRSYQSYRSAYIRAEKAELEYWKFDRNMGKAMQFASEPLKHQLVEAFDKVLELIQDLKTKYMTEDQTVEEKIKEEYPKFLEYVHKVCVNEFKKRTEEAYQEAVKKENGKEYAHAARIYNSIRWYKDSADKFKECNVKIDREKKLKRRKKTLSIWGIVVTAIVVFSAKPLYSNVIYPALKYNEATHLLEAGKYEEASKAFGALGWYKDSITQSGRASTMQENAELEKLKPFAKPIIDAYVEMLEEALTDIDRETKDDIIKSITLEYKNWSIKDGKINVEGVLHCNVNGVDATRNFVAEGQEGSMNATFRLTN